MGEYYFIFKKSQEGVKTLIVYSVNNAFMSSIPNVVKVFTGNDAERLYQELVGK